MGAGGDGGGASGREVFGRIVLFVVRTPLTLNAPKDVLTFLDELLDDVPIAFEHVDTY
jgi:hypothetical protein